MNVLSTLTFIINFIVCYMSLMKTETKTLHCKMALIHYIYGFQNTFLLKLKFY